MAKHIMPQKEIYGQMGLKLFSTTEKYDQITLLDLTIAYHYLHDPFELLALHISYVKPTMSKVCDYLHLLFCLELENALFP